MRDRRNHDVAIVSCIGAPVAASLPSQPVTHRSSAAGLRHAMEYPYPLAHQMRTAGLDCAIVNALTKRRKQTRTDIMASSEELNGRALLGGSAGETKGRRGNSTPGGRSGVQSQIKVTARHPHAAAPQPRPSSPLAPPPHPRGRVQKFSRQPV